MLYKTGMKYGINTLFLFAWWKEGMDRAYPKYEEPYEGCVIIEGLHALNPKISSGLHKDKILKLFVSVSTNINHEGERILSGRKVRFVRRLVRDSIYRAANAERTLSMWKKVLMAEDVYLYPYKASADLAFNTFHSFELSVMKSFALSLISKSLAEADVYAGTVLSALELIEGMDHSLVPDNSLIREFIPGGIYESLY
jgi:uridine kinase